ncbi:MAG: hypothetical protein J0H27_08870 [Xanthomonadales bacterium]|nr:hypothetical protein [Xanthomonadales bacterium]
MIANVAPYVLMIGVTALAAAFALAVARAEKRGWRDRKTSRPADRHRTQQAGWPWRHP